MRCGIRAVTLALGLLGAAAFAGPGDAANAKRTSFVLPSSNVELEQTMREALASRISCKPEAPIEARIDLSHMPRLNQSFTAVFSVVTTEFLHHATVSWDIPAGLEIVDQRRAVATDSQVDTKGITQYPILLKFTKTGNYEIAASIVETGFGFSMGRRVHLYFEVTTQGVTVRDMPAWVDDPNARIPRKASGTEKITINPHAERFGRQSLPAKTEMISSDDDPDVIAANQTRTTVGTARVFGYFHYMHNDGTFHPAWNSVAEVWDRDSFSGDDLISNPVIGWNGFFDTGNFDNTNDGDLFDGVQQDVYFRFASYNGRVNVVEHDSGNTFVTGIVNVGNNIADGDHNVGGWTYDLDGPGGYPDDSWEAMFEICETTSIGWLNHNGLGWDVPGIAVRWAPGTTDGAYYNGGGTRRISLRDGDQQDESVILHEYGHHVYEMAKGGQPAGCCIGHAWFGCYNGGLALSEGYATYAGQTSMGSRTYCDTPGVGDTANFCVDVESTTASCYSASVGTTGEASVASALWDIYDGLPSDPHNDRLNLGGGQILTALRSGGAFGNILDLLAQFYAQNLGFDSAVYDIMVSHNIYAPSDNYVTVEIDHTYRGDLIVDVGVGDPARPLYVKTLWNRGGGSADNLYITGDISDAPLFYRIPSESAVWWVRVSDNAGGDVGVLRRFSLKANGVTYVSGNNNQALGDFATVFAWLPTRSSIFGNVDVRHTYRGDLLVTLGIGDPNAPLYTRVLSNRAGGSIDDVWFQFNLDGLTGYMPPDPWACDMHGWWVKVEDQASGDVGTIQNFAINNNGSVYTQNDGVQSIADFSTSWQRMYVRTPNVYGYDITGRRGEATTLWGRVGIPILSFFFPDICRTVYFYDLNGLVGSATTGGDGWAGLNYVVPNNMPYGANSYSAFYFGSFFDYGNNASATIMVFPVGDTDNSGCVDDTDLTGVILDYGGPPSGSYGDTDVDNNGVVDDADITIVIINYGEGC